MPETTLSTFLRNLDSLDFTRRRMEGLFGGGQIVLRDLLPVYESLFIRAVTHFEAFLEDHFIAILEGRAGRNRARLRMKVTSRVALMEILLQGEKYLDWLPYKKTEDRAKLYFHQGGPFCELSDGDKSTIKTIATIRNAIAHSSAHARAEFERTVIANLALLRGERRPAGFLRSQVRQNPAQNRFEVYVTELARIASDLR